MNSKAKLKKISILMTLVFICSSQSIFAEGPRLPKSGGKVSLDFHDVDIKDVINAISEITGKNFIYAGLTRT